MTMPDSNSNTSVLLRCCCVWNCQLLLPGWMLGQGGVGKGVVLELLPFLSYQVDASRFLGQADIIIVS